MTHKLSFACAEMNHLLIKQFFLTHRWYLSRSLVAVWLFFWCGLFCLCSFLVACLLLVSVFSVFVLRERG